MECNEQDILAVSQPTSCVTIVSDTHTTFSSVPVTTLSVSGPHISTITSTAGMYSHTQLDIISKCEQVSYMHSTVYNLHDQV